MWVYVGHVLYCTWHSFGLSHMPVVTDSSGESAAQIACSIQAGDEDPTSPKSGTAEGPPPDATGTCGAGRGRWSRNVARVRQVIWCWESSKILKTYYRNL